jgi:hypothetical protein
MSPAEPSSPFKTNAQRGFWLTFKNGWTVSVQFGPGAYGSNYDEPFEGRNERGYEAATAEVWAWDASGKSVPDEPLGWQTTDQLAAFIDTIRRKRKSRAKAAA